MIRGHGRERRDAAGSGARRTIGGPAARPRAGAACDVLGRIGCPGVGRGAPEGSRPTPPGSACGRGTSIPTRSPWTIAATPSGACRATARSPSPTSLPASPRRTSTGCAPRSPPPAPSRVLTRSTSASCTATAIRWVSARGRGGDEGIVGRMMFGVFLDTTDAQGGRRGARPAGGRDGPPGQEPVRHRLQPRFDRRALRRDHHRDGARPHPALGDAGAGARPDPPDAGRARAARPRCLATSSPCSSRPTTTGASSATASAWRCRRCASERGRPRRSPSWSTSLRPTRSSTGRCRRRAARSTCRASSTTARWRSSGRSGAGRRFPLPRDPAASAASWSSRSLGQQLGGSIAYEWPPEGAVVTLRMSRARLAV